MSKKTIGLIIVTIILGIATTALATLFVLQIIKASDLENTVNSQTQEIEQLKKEIDELKKTAEQAEESYDVAKVIGAIKDNGNIGDHVRGKKNSKVVVVEYADLQCPGCASMAPQMHQLAEKYGDKVAFVFRHYPLPYHNNAKSAAMATEAAAKQGYFWEMMEALYEYRVDWMQTSGSELVDAYVDIFEQVAPDGDSAKFKNDLDDAKSEKKINFDTAIGSNESHVSATPSFYVNGKAVEMDGVETLQDFADKIEKTIQEELQ